MQYISHYRSPIGNILLAADEIGLTGLWFEGQKYFALYLDKEHEEKEIPIFEKVKEWLTIYFSGKEPDFTVPLHFTGTDFQNEVWEILCTIPYGQTMTYGEIAKQIAVKKGLPRMSAQAVGGAVGHNEISIIVPCHRVVGTNGSLTGYAGGIEKKSGTIEVGKCGYETIFYPRERDSIMKPANLEAIQHSFTIQAPNFESQTVNFSKEEYLNYTISRVASKGQDSVLEVAAGTCACGRSFAPLVQSVVCLDATPSMLQIGKQEAEKSHLNNMTFVKGYAEELPFLNDSFTIVFSRLAFHHFTDTDAVFSEMVRVLKPGGKLVMIDMEAADEPLRKTEDEIETLRDPSHVKNMSKNEMLELFTAHSLQIEECETTKIQQKLNNWLALTRTPEPIQQKITERMRSELAGKEKTGFSPYVENGKICFNQKWLLLIGRKQ